MTRELLIPIRRARPVDDAPTPIRELAYLVHLGGIEFEIEDRHVLLQALALGGARDHDRAFLDEKAQAYLPGRLAVMHADQPQLRVACGAAPRDRAVGGDRQAMTAAGGGRPPHAAMRVA